MRRTGAKHLGEATKLGLIMMATLMGQRHAEAITAYPKAGEVIENGRSVPLYLIGDERSFFYVTHQGFPVIPVERTVPAQQFAPAPGGAPANAVDQPPQRIRSYRYGVFRSGSFVPSEQAVGATLPPPEAVTVQSLAMSTPQLIGVIAKASSPIDTRMANAPEILPNGNSPQLPPSTPAKGEVHNLVILLRFSDHKLQSRVLPSKSDYDTIFNKPGGDPGLAPTGSVRDVYTENSLGKMTLTSVVHDWVDVPKSEFYYANGVSGLGGSNIREALRSALDAVDPDVNFRDFDRDGDGFIDAVTFIHSGFGAEWGFADQVNKLEKDRIWSHQSNLGAASWVSQEGVQVNNYHISTGLWGRSGSSPTHIGVVAHELGHFFGLPDLYDYSKIGSGAGCWSLMANSWGFDGTQQHPPQFDAWSKVKLGWITPDELRTPGVYEAPPVEKSGGKIFKIAEGFPGDHEYLLIENRQPIGYDDGMPIGPGGKGGLAIWHIDESKSLNNEPGWPTQPDWPGNQKHYKVALVQADGRFDLERSSQMLPADRAVHGSGDGWDLFRPGFVSELSGTTQPDLNSYTSSTSGPARSRLSRIAYRSATDQTLLFEFQPNVTNPQPAHGGDVTGVPTRPENNPPPLRIGSRPTQLIASMQFDDDENKTITGNAVVATLEMDLDQPMRLLVHSDTSVAATARGVDLTMGFEEADDPNRIWAGSMRLASLPEGGRWESISSSYTVRMPAGKHKLHWKIWAPMTTVQMAPGSFSIHGVPDPDGVNKVPPTEPSKASAQSPFLYSRDAAGRRVIWLIPKP